MYDQSSYDSTATYDSAGSEAGAAAAIVLLLLSFIVLIVIMYVVNAIFLGMVFKKAGIEPWKAWVPIYNYWIMLEMGDEPGWWSLLSIIPLVNYVALVFIYIAQYRIGLKFGKDGVFVLLAIFVPIVWVIWLAVDSSKWRPRLHHPSSK